MPSPSLQASGYLHVYAAVYVTYHRHGASPAAACLQVIDMPLLFETRFNRFTSPNIVVACEPDVQVGEPGKACMAR
jgi:hypothetical protein